MKKNIILGVKPFNDLFFRSCYYHQLLAGISVFNVNKDEVLLNFFTLIREHFELEEVDFTGYKKINNSKGYKIRYCNVNKKQLIKAINKGYPVILGIDCYYLESKKETYFKTHEPHFLLVYGYDLSNDLANIVEHDYRNDYNYTHKVVSLNNIILANKKFKYISKKKQTARIISKNTHVVKGTTIWNYLTPNVLCLSKKNGKDNLIVLKHMFANIPEYVLEIHDKLSRYLNNLKMQYHIINQTNLFKEDTDKQNTITSLIIAYSTILSVIWKVGYVKNVSYIKKNEDKLLAKIDEMIELESKLYDYLMEVSRTHVL